MQYFVKGLACMQEGTKYLCPIFGIIFYSLVQSKQGMIAATVSFEPKLKTVTVQKRFIHAKQY